MTDNYDVIVIGSGAGDHLLVRIGIGERQGEPAHVS
jgi:hypothetical protein